MKKILLILGGIVLAAVILIVALFLKNPWSNKWQVYNNSRYQFSLNYPSAWRLGEEPANNDGRVFYSPSNDQECRAFGFTNALTNSRGEPQSLEEYVDWFLSEGNVQMLNRKQTKLSGYDAVQITTQESNLIRVSIYALGKESGRALICTFNNAKSQQEFNETFEQMVSSFKITSNLDGP